jgi:hypothetical protein
VWKISNSILTYFLEKMTNERRKTMATSYAQRQAVLRYAEKKRAKGMKSRTLFATDNQWKLLLPLSRFIKTINFDNLEGVTIDDEKGLIIFNVKEGQKLTTESEDSMKDDTTYHAEKETSVQA